jgi:glycerophosphoryl diester phosphodiesterase
MRAAARALQALIAVGIALILVAPAAQADVLDEIVVAHRAGATGKYGEGTLKSYKFSVANHADILDGDIHWTKDSPNDSDKLGTILIIHDSTLDRITNCKGKSPPGAGDRSVLSAAPTTASSRSSASRT